jgi:hypothetical protein
MQDLRIASLEEKSKATAKDGVNISRRLTASPFPPLWGKDRMGGGVRIRTTSLEEYPVMLCLRSASPC